MAKTERVAILGASEDPSRYSYLAFEMLKEHGHIPIPVSPKVKLIHGTPVLATLSEIQTPIDTLTMYVNPRLSTELRHEIMDLHPRRVIFNPGSENPELGAALKKAGSQVVEACTLVLLRTGQF